MLITSLLSFVSVGGEQEFAHTAYENAPMCQAKDNHPPVPLLPVSKAVTHTNMTSELSHYRLKTHWMHSVPRAACNLSTNRDATNSKHPISLFVLNHMETIKGCTPNPPKGKQQEKANSDGDTLDPEGEYDAKPCFCSCNWNNQAAGL